MKGLGVDLAAAAWSFGISNAIYFGTGLVILWYTIETRRLRREAQLQTELQNRPFVSIEVYPALKDRKASVRPVNLGKGLARNVSIQAIDDATLFEVRAWLTHIASGRDDVEPTWRLKSRLSGTQPLTDYPGDDHDSAAHSLLSLGDFMIVLKYTSIVDQHYKTTVRLTKGGASIENDRRITGTRFR